MQVEPLRAEDAPELLALASFWNQGSIVITPGAHGAVIREDGCVQAWALLRETNYGFITDELWCRKTRLGRIALGEIARWLETTVANVARARGLEYMELGGIVRLDNPLHDAALDKRGYEKIANVRAKRIYSKADASQEMVAV